MVCRAGPQSRLLTKPTTGAVGGSLGGLALRTHAVICQTAQTIKERGRREDVWLVTLLDQLDVLFRPDVPRYRATRKLLDIELIDGNYRPSARVIYGVYRRLQPPQARQ